jgi:uncharacterized protein YbaP (TraB family)
MRVLACTLLLVVSCARPSCPPPAYAGLEDGRPFVWEVSGPRGQGVLFGTLHAAARGDVPDAALDRLRDARLLVTEIPPLERKRVEPLTRLPPGQDLAALLGEPAWSELRGALSGVLREDELRRARPWYAMSLLTAAMVDGPEVSMDAALLDVARRRGTPLSFLETPEEQLAALGEAVTAEDLRQALAERKGMRCAVHDLVAAYRSGDARAVRAALAGDAEARLLTARNQRWVPVIEELLGDAPFIAVGVSHLVGEGSLPALLEARGYTVTRVGAP